ncbi:MAG: hypothetical protein IJ443_05040 [Firmicutes bacterium]|nr:hypothetical protein [Bacillota bacterium]
MKYCVTYKIEARYIAQVEADCAEEARKKAEQGYVNADFGEASDIDGEPIIVEDESGNFVWEK